ncbi:MAG: restriction endonuclease subunit S [Nostoc sp. JL31]|uniref:restriction endonuclease subunit S n=1 Tax=Nostoc sp. JL31 TaxID=2815395 RepID=UPI0025E0CEB3|nr:restriction endonuclease subunit S [Nostoc sp. JL31]MBN3892795.1 restriction endonuclease subunit S [Nostoc sp. JL31]
MNSQYTKKWIPYKLNELGSVGRGRSRHRPRNAPELYGGDYPFIQTAEVTASEFYITSYSQTYSELGLGQSKMWNKDTLCIVNAGENTAETAILKFNACFPDSIIGFIADPQKADVRFIKYYLTTIKEQLRSITKGATQDNLSVDKLLSFDILTPPLTMQKKIAGILSAYDDLIENNTRRIKILEEMAQTLYHEWFVKFRFPGHEHTKMVDSELGLIPEGWEVKKLGKLASFQTGKLNSNAAKPDGIYPFFTCSQDIFKTDTYSFDTECILLAGNNANGIFHLKFFRGKFDVYQRTYVIRTLNDSKVTNYYLYFAIKEQLDHLKSISIGAATKFLTLTILNNIDMTLANGRLQQKFANFISAVFTQIEVLQAKNSNLRQTRDLLLPKLISGEIDVEHLDITTEDIAA